MAYVEECITLCPAPSASQGDVNTIRSVLAFDKYRPALRLMELNLNVDNASVFTKTCPVVVHAV